MFVRFIYKPLWLFISLSKLQIVQISIVPWYSKRDCRQQYTHWAQTKSLPMISQLQTRETPMTLLLGCLKPQSGDSINSWLRCGQMMVTTWTSKWYITGPKYVPDERPLQINPWASVLLFFRFLMGEEYLWDTRVPVVTTLLVETTLSLPVTWLCKRDKFS